MLKTMFWKYQSPKTRASFRVLEEGLGSLLEGRDSGDVEDEEEDEDEGGMGKRDLGLEGNLDLVKRVGRFVGLD